MTGHDDVPRTPTGGATDISEPQPPLGRVLWPLVYCGWAIGALRLLLDAFAPDVAMYVGLYYLLPLVLIVFVAQRRFEPHGMGRCLLVAVVAAPLISFPVNTLAYGAAQFAGWTHGRFADDRALPVAEELADKLLSAVVAGLGTSLAGTVWLVLFTWVIVGTARLVRRRFGSA